MTDKTWKKILKLPGLSGGQVNWKLVGTNKGQPIVETNVFTMTIAAPEPAGKPVISPVTQTQPRPGGIHAGQSSRRTSAQTAHSANQKN